MQLKPEIRNRIEKKIGHKFKDSSLLDVALRHRSSGRVNNERLEFLGDAVLELIISEELYRSLSKNVAEGQLTRMRATLVRRETLAAVASELELNNFVVLSASERRSGGQQSSSVLADSLEALIAAIYLDTNLAATKKIILSWFGSRLQHLQKDPDSAATKDYKTSLQEKLQAAGLELPSYNVQLITGQAHEQEFVVECRVIKELVGKELVASGSGSSRRKAEQIAAGLILEQLVKYKK